MNRVAVVQIKASVRKDENLRKATDYIREAKKKNADLVAFPEFLMAYSPGDQSAEELCQMAEAVDGEFTSTLRDAAKSTKL